MAKTISNEEIRERLKYMLDTPGQITAAHIKQLYNDIDGVLEGRDYAGAEDVRAESDAEPDDAGDEEEEITDEEEEA